MIWILFLVLAHIFYAGGFIIDKYILSRPMPNAVVYTFWIGVLGIAILTLIPISFLLSGNNGFIMPDGSEIFWSLIAGIVQVWALIVFYNALNKSEVTRLVPLVGGLSSVFVLILNSISINEFLSNRQFLAVAMFVLAGLIVSIKKDGFLNAKIIWSAILSAFLFAVFWVTTKYLFQGTNFISGVVWVRIGVAIVSLALLFSKKNRELVLVKTKDAKPKTTGFFLLGRLTNVAGGLFLYLAVFLGSVVLATALQGLEYVFILILALILFKKIPNIKEQFSREFLFQKIIAVMLICVGLGLLVL